MRVLIDTNVVLDFSLNREPFVREADVLFQANVQGHFEGYVPANPPVNLFYIARKQLDNEGATQVVEQLLTQFRVCPINLSVLELALTYSFSDFEDAVQHASAAALQLDAIVTRDTKDFRQATLPVSSPPDFRTALSRDSSD